MKYEWSKIKQPQFDFVIFLVTYFLSVTGLYIKIFFNLSLRTTNLKKSTCPTQSFSCPKKLIKITKTRE